MVSHPGLGMWVDDVSADFSLCQRRRVQPSHGGDAQGVQIPPEEKKKTSWWGSWLGGGK